MKTIKEMQTLINFLIKIMVIDVDEIEFSEMHIDINTCELYELQPKSIELLNYFIDLKIKCAPDVNGDDDVEYFKSQLGSFK